MNSRLQQFLSAENLSQAQFADIIGVARASVSHIIAGRNKPGFDFIEGMLTNFPNLNVEWLISGRGKMYKTAPGLFPVAEEADAAAIEKSPPYQAPVPDPVPPQTPVKEQEPIETITPTQLIKSSDNQRTITKIIVFFSDNSYQELK